MENNNFYTVTKHLLNVYAKNYRSLGFKAQSKDEFYGWKEQIKQKLIEITGLDQMEVCPLCPELLESSRQETHIREKWLIQTEPDVWMPFYILKPLDIKPGEKRPAFIEPHGHGGGKEMTAEVEELTQVKMRKEKKQSKDKAFSKELVEAGYIVFCPDARGSGERREWTKQTDDMLHLTGNTHFEINNMAISLGQSMAGMLCWDLMRLIDYIETVDYCDADRVGCGGMSGGGMQTIWLAALDDRIKLAVTGGYFYGYGDSLLKLSNNCACNFVPNLWKYIDMGDLGALIAPRPLLIKNGDRDHLNGEAGIDNVIPQVNIAKAAYKLFGQEDKLVHMVFSGVHEWNGTGVLEFVQKWL